VAPVVTWVHYLCGKTADFGPGENPNSPHAPCPHCGVAVGGWKRKDRELVVDGGEVLGYVATEQLPGLPVRWVSWRPAGRDPIGMHQDRNQAVGFLRQLALATRRRLR
jgi:hypothetical protein